MKQKTIFISFFCLQLIACDNFNSLNKFEFYYYPARNVYYDVAKAQFVYSVNGGKTWEIFQKDVVKDPSTLGTKQIIHSDSPEPWKNNSEDIKKYNGKVYILSDADTTSQTEIVSNKKIIKKSKPVDSVQPEEQEKKVGFFRRLFGGRKKKN